MVNHLSLFSYPFGPINTVSGRTKCICMETNQENIWGSFGQNHWGLADLQCGVSFGCIAKWFSYTSTYIVILLLRFFSCRCYYRILSSLCYMVGPCWSSASSMVVYVCEEGSHVKSCGLELHTIDPYRFGLLGKLSPHSPCSLPLLGLSFCLTLISQLSLLS